MSHQITIIEKKEAVETHERNIIKEKAVNSIHEGLKNRNPKYDLIGMYPPVPKLVAIGDLHGDIMITLSVLKLAEVMFQYIGGLRAGMGYCGASKIEDLKSSKFIKLVYK